jgi:4-alpha-glucanotransferase
MITDALRRRAGQLGVQLTYEDVDQVEHDADPDVVERVVEILDADRLRTDGHDFAPSIHLRPSQPIDVDGAVDDAELSVDGTAATVTVEQRGGTSRIVLPDTLPLGCHELRIDVGSASAECLVVVAPSTMPSGDRSSRTSSLFAPAYALWDSDEPLPSFALLGRLARAMSRSGVETLATLPLYATFLDEPYDPSPYSPVSRLHWNEVYLDDASLPTAPVPDLGDAVDWRALGARRRHQLVVAAIEADDDLIERLARFAAAHPDVGSYARFRARRESGGDLVVERSHVLAQYLADEQLGAIAADPDAAGLSLDLPIGSHPDGWETWAHPHLFAEAMAVGAPPDTFFTEGQNWGFPPQLPTAMRTSGYELWRQLVTRAGRHASMLRIDHVMAVHRLWWVPDGQPADRGVYVTYSHDELLAVIAATAAAAGVAVVGENLGTVPPIVDTAMNQWEMLGMFEEQFAMDDEHLATVPARSVAGVRTHDMAPFAEALATREGGAALARYRRLLGDPSGPLLDAVIARLAASDAQMIVADLDDLLDEIRPHNVPGRVVHGIWQRRLDDPLTDTLADERVQRRLALLRRGTA